MKKYILGLLLLSLVSCSSSPSYYKDSDFADDIEREFIFHSIMFANIDFCSSHYRPPKNREEFIHFLEEKLRADSCSEQQIDSLKTYKYTASEIYKWEDGYKQTIQIYSKRITNTDIEKKSYQYYYDEVFVPSYLSECDGDNNLFLWFKCAATDKDQNFVPHNSPKLKIRELYPIVDSIIMDSPRAQQYAIVPPEPEDESFGHTILYYQNGQQLMNFVTNKVMNDTISVKIEALLKNWCDKNGLIEIYLPVNPRW